MIAAVNKTDGLDEDTALAEFSGFGISTTLPLSAAHNRGTDDLIATCLPLLPAGRKRDAVDEGESGSIRVAIVGRPNAGKSTLINRLLGEDRLIVSDVAGTTRDPIRVPLERDGKRYTLIDTAGVRRKAQGRGGGREIQRDQDPAVDGRRAGGGGDDRCARKPGRPGPHPDWCVRWTRAGRW